MENCITAAKILVRDSASQLAVDFAKIIIESLEEEFDVEEQIIWN